jgi:broad specificity phosphatase PhoE
MVLRYKKHNASKIEILLSRHAKAEHNIYNGEGTFAGYRVDSKLTEEGVAETEFVASQVLRDGGCSVIIHSGQIRSKMTAEIIKKHLYMEGGHDIGLMEINELHEIDVGEFTGHTADWAMNKYPKQYRAFSEGDIHHWDFPGGESYSDATKRIRTLTELIQRIEKQEKKLLLVGHGMLNRVILNCYLPDHPELWKPGLYPHDRLVAFDL